MKEQELEHVVTASYQRAGLMGFLLCLLEEENELSMNEVKQKAVSIFTTMMSLDLMVRDEIDMEVARACRNFCEQEKALMDFKEILN